MFALVVIIVKVRHVAQPGLAPAFPQGRKRQTRPVRVCVGLKLLLVYHGLSFVECIGRNDAAPGS